MAIDQKKTMLIVGGIVAAVVIVLIIVVSWFTGSPASVPVDQTGIPAESSGGFDLSVLQRAGYKALDQRPIQDGLLPVPAPATTGKANPFL